MQPPSSSTSSSERAAALRTALWFVAFLAAFEIGMRVLLAHGPLGATSIGQYFLYGESYETKLRRLAHTKDLPSNSILYAGWLDAHRFAEQPSEADVTIYGASFVANSGAVIAKLRPDLKMRTIAGPGTPLNHTYAAYQLDRPLRKTRVAVVGLVSVAVPEVLLMNRGSLYNDSPFPYFFPRYDLVDGKLQRQGDSLINSAAELRSALDDPQKWRAQLDVLAKHDDGYRRWYFASDVFDGSALGRLLRRSLSKKHQDSYLKAVHGPRGFDRKHHAVVVFRALLDQLISELRIEGVRPIFVNYATLGDADHLDQITDDIYERTQVPHLSTVPICSPGDASNYIPDGHFTEACNEKVARALLKVLEPAVGTSHVGEPMATH